MRPRGGARLRLGPRRVRILTGTSGWSYAAWKGAFYPERMPAARMLEAYAARLAAVEVNNTFHRMPRATVLAGWAAQVPAGFTFALKGPQRITHFQRLAGAADAVAWFLRAAAELGPALGPILWQLPPTLHPDVPRLSEFLGLLPPGGRFAFEFRDRAWLGDDVLALLAARGAAICWTEDEAGATPPVATGGFGYLRLRRPDYGPAELRAWAERIRAQRWSEAFVFFKHEDEARGPRFALAMAELAGADAAQDGAGAGAAP
jgi:uncharacterized protein YecE (DUF72 family)